jgi:hypothetical protein
MNAVAHEAKSSSGFIPSMNSIVYTVRICWTTQREKGIKEDGRNGNFSR